MDRRARWIGFVGCASLLVACAEGADSGETRVEAEMEGYFMCMERAENDTFVYFSVVRPDPRPDAVEVDLYGDLRLLTYYPEDGTWIGSPAEDHGLDCETAGPVPVRFTARTGGEVVARATGILDEFVYNPP